MHLLPWLFVIMLVFLSMLAVWLFQFYALLILILVGIF